MLRIYSVVLQVLADLRPVVELIETRDRELGEQLRSVLSSVVLNTSEGGGSQKRNVRARYFNALGSMKESRACLDVAVAWAYIAPIDPALERGQKERLARYKARRDATAVETALTSVADAARGSQNLLIPMKAALRADATLGEISDTLRGVFGTYQP